MSKVSQSTKRKVEELILRVILPTHNKLTTNQVAESIGRSWEFTEKRLNNLHRKGRVNREKTKGGVTLWWT